MPIRAAIWSAVSSEAQAKEDKVSLEVQIDRARQLILSRSWVETAGPYIAIASRTRWVDLKDAAQAIPDLALMLTEAQAHLFDVLVIFDYTRLRTLLTPLSKTLSAYAIQIFSLSQPIEIIDPAKYDPTNADTATIMEFAAGFTSQAEIASLKRRFRLGMPKRILEKGLTKGQLPYGYRKPIGHETDRQITPEQNPVQAAVLIQIKDMFLSGKSFWEIADHLTAQKIPTPANKDKWRDIMVRSLINNKFYNGKVTFGKKRSITDPLTGKVKSINNPPSAIHIGTGRHVPLWDDATAAAIEAEMRSRGQTRYSGKQTARLSNITYCGTCNARLWVGYADSYANPEKRVYFCSADRSHLVIKERELLPIFIAELKKRLSHTEDLIITPKQDTNFNIAALKELQTRLTRVDQAYETGAMTLEKYTERSADLINQIESIEKQISDTSQTTARLKQKSEAINSFAKIIQQTDYLTEAPAQQVNTHLRRIIKKIIVTSQKVTIEF